MDDDRYSADALYGNWCWSNGAEAGFWWGLVLGAFVATVLFLVITWR
jgi:hypothetical protein